MLTPFLFSFFYSLYIIQLTPQSHSSFAGARLQLSARLSAVFADDRTQLAIDLRHHGTDVLTGLGPSLSGSVHTGASTVHTGASALYTGASAVHTGAPAVHTGGSGALGHVPGSVHTGASAVHTRASAVHTGDSAVHTGGPGAPRVNPNVHGSVHTGVSAVHTGASGAAGSGAPPTTHTGNAVPQRATTTDPGDAVPQRATTTDNDGTVPPRANPADTGNAVPQRANLTPATAAAAARAEDLIVSRFDLSLLVAIRRPPAVSVPAPTPRSVPSTTSPPYPVFGPAPSYNTGVGKPSYTGGGPDSPCSTGGEVASPPPVSRVTPEAQLQSRIELSTGGGSASYNTEGGPGKAASAPPPVSRPPTETIVEAQLQSRIDLSAAGGRASYSNTGGGPGEAVSAPPPVSRPPTETIVEAQLQSRIDLSADALQLRVLRDLFRILSQPTHEVYKVSWPLQDISISNIVRYTLQYRGSRRCNILCNRVGDEGQGWGAQTEGCLRRI